MEPHEVALSDVHVYGPSLTNTDTSHKDYQGVVLNICMHTYFVIH